MQANSSQGSCFCGIMSEIFLPTPLTAAITQPLVSLSMVARERASAQNQVTMQCDLHAGEGKGPASSLSTSALRYEVL